jgi:hypothetical protein
MKIHHSLPAIFIILLATFPVAPSIAGEELNSIQGEKNNRSEKYKNLNRRQKPSSSTPKEQSTPIKSKQGWEGMIKIELQKEAPQKSYIANNLDWAKLWKTYRENESLPKVDFDREIVLVSINNTSDPFQIIPSLSVTGNLTFTTLGTPTARQKANERAYVFELIDRTGIKTIDGKPISNN